MIAASRWGYAAKDDGRLVTFHPRHSEVRFHWSRRRGVKVFVRCSKLPY